MSEKYIMNEVDYLEEIKERVRKTKRFVEFCESLTPQCSHDKTIMHRAHDGFDRFRCTKCGNIQVAYTVMFTLPGKTLSMTVKGDEKATSED